MKVYFLISISILLFFGCSTSDSSHTFTTFSQINTHNSILKTELQENYDAVEMLMAIPQTINRVKPYYTVANNILQESQELYNKITSDMVELLNKNGADVIIKGKPYEFQELSVFNEKIADAGSVSLTGSNELKNEIKKFSNLICTRIDFYYSNKFYFDKLMKTIPEILSVNELNFENQCLIGELENLNLLRQKILLACNKSFQYIRSIVTQNRFTFNHVEPVVYKREGPARHKDSIEIKVNIAAYDSTFNPPIRYSTDGGKEHLVKDNKLIVPKNAREIRGTIAVKQDGELVWKPWSYHLK